MDVIGRFISDRCEMVKTKNPPADFAVTVAGLYNTYSGWCENNGCDPVAKARGVGLNCSCAVEYLMLIAM